MAASAQIAVMSPTYSKKKGDRNLNQSINIRSNKKAMHPNQRKQSEKQEPQMMDDFVSKDNNSESDVSLYLPSMRSEVQSVHSAKPKREVLACNLRIDTTMKQFERQGGRQMFEENLATSLGISMSSVQVTGMREGSVILDYNLIVDKNSKMSIDELKAMQSEKMKAGAIDVGGPVLSFSSTLPTPTPTPDEKPSNKKTIEHVPSESFSESENEIPEPVIEAPRKKQQPPEPEHKSTINEFENLSNEFSDPEEESEESSDEEESDASSEDEETKREMARRNRKKQ